MPTPRKGESEKDFVSRCIPVVIKEGTAKDSSQGSAICHSMWRQHQKKQRAISPEIFVLDVFAAAVRCECIACGYKMTSEVHCKDVRCPKCGGTMRREERPGPGQASVAWEAFLEFEAQDGRPKTHVQTLIMSKSRFPTRAAAKRWAKDNSFKADTIRETTNSWRLRQRPPEDFKQTSFKVINMTTGVQAVIGHLK